MDKKTLFRKHMEILVHERATTNFGHATDTLSRAITELRNGLASMYEGYCYDSHFDGGEFSGPAYGRMVNDHYVTVAGKYGYASVADMENKVRQATTAKFAYDMFAHYCFRSEPDVRDSRRSW